MPTNDELYAEAEQLKEAGDLEGAVAKLNELIAADNDYALAHSALAVFCGRLDNHELAIKHGLEVCRIEPDDAFSFTAMSVTYQRGGRIPEAEEAMARAQMIQQGAH
jgi:tetratricopeptide (TPR) repeat protein